MCSFTLPGRGKKKKEEFKLTGEAKEHSEHSQQGNSYNNNLWFVFGAFNSVATSPPLTQHSMAGMFLDCPGQPENEASLSCRKTQLGLGRSPKLAARLASQ